MKNQKIKNLKRVLKKKIKITMTLLIGFMMTGGIVFAATPLKDDTTQLVTNENTATGKMTPISIGGRNNKIKTADGWGEAIIGGYENEISGAGANPNGIFNSVKSKIGVFDDQGNPIKAGNETHRSTIIGGQNHIVKGYDNIILGGGDNNSGNTIGGNQILGGDNNAILGGMKNKIDQAQNKYWTNNNILGGKGNIISKKVENSSILNGEGNTISGTSKNSAIIAGNNNFIKNSEQNNGIFAGLGNTIDNANHRNAIIGGQNSKISGTAGKQGFDNVIIGGGDTDKGANEIINNDNSTVIGGYKNIITGNANDKYQDDNIILGGHTNSITGTAKDSAILAGDNNTASGLNSVVVGGAKNIASGKGAVVIGGGFYENGTEIGNIAAALNSSVLGGVNNQISESAYRSSIIGGYINNVSSIDSIILGGHHNTVEGNNSAIIAGNKNSTTAEDSLIFGGFNNNIIGGSKNFILGGVNNTVSGAFSGAIGGDGNNVSGSKSYTIGSTNTISGSTSYAFGNSNNVLSEVDYIIGENNEIAGSHNYIIGSNNISTQEKVYILGSDVDASGVANAVVLGDRSKAVENAVSVGTETAPRNIKHVRDGEISDTSLDAINGSQVTTITEKGTVDDTYIAVERDSSKENGTDPHIKGHKKHYKIGLTKEATDAITNAKKIPQLETAIQGKVNKTDVTGDITSSAGTVTITGGDDKLLGDVNIEVADGAITEEKLAPALKNKIDNAVTDVNLITSSDLTVGNGGDLKTGNVNLAIKNGAINMNNLGKDVIDALNNSNVIVNNNTDGIGEGKTEAVTGGVIHQYLTQNYYDINKVQDLLDKKVDKSSMNKSLTSKTIEVTGDGASKLYDAINIEIKDGAITKDKLSDDLKNKIDGKIGASDIHNITSSTLTITGGGTNNEGNVANSDVNIEIKDKSITEDKLSDTLSTKINNKISKTDLQGSKTIALTENNGKTEFSVVDGSIGATQFDTTTNETLAKVGSGKVESGDQNTITGNVVFDAIKKAKTKVDVKGDYLTINKTETEDVEANNYELGLDIDAVKEDLATGNITGTGITVENGDKSTFKDVKLTVNVDDETVMLNDDGQISAKEAEFIQQGADFKLKTGKDGSLKDGLVKASTMLGILNDSVSKETVSAGYGIKVTSVGDEGAKNRNFEVALSDDIVKKIDGATGGAASGMAMAGIPQVTYDRLFGIGAGAAYYGGHGAFAVGVSGQNKARNFVWKVNGSVSTKGTLGVAAGFNVSLGSRLLDKVKDIPVANNKELDKLKERVAKLEANKSVKFIVDNFVLDKDKITARQLEKLKYIVETINTNYPNSVIEIHGFTDIQYKDKYNMDLGLRRARNGKAMLIELGLKNENIIVLSKGYNEMLDGSYGKNRRIEILVNHFNEYIK